MMERAKYPRNFQGQASKPTDELEELERRAKEAFRTVVIPPYQPPTPDELVRRREAGRRIDEFRERIGKVPFNVTDLIRGGREELE